jgi:hypothetical protein
MKGDVREIGGYLFRDRGDGYLEPVGPAEPKYEMPVQPQPEKNALAYYLGGTGIPERLGALNSLFNPVEGIGQSMQASQRMFAPETSGWGRVEAAGDMMSGMAGAVAPAVVASRVGAPAANALADSLTGVAMPQRAALAEFAGSEYGGVGLNSRPWFHGTPDSRPIKAGGFADGNRPVYMTDKYSIAESYADDTRAFDYQNATPEVLKVQASPQRVVDIDADGGTFKGIDAAATRQGFVAAGADPQKVDDLVAKYQRTDGKISTYALEKMMREFEFEAADIANVRDAYMFSAKRPKSTVRIVMNPETVQLVKKFGIAVAAAMLGVNQADLAQAANTGAMAAPQQAQANDDLAAIRDIIGGPQ